MNIETTGRLIHPIDPDYLEYLRDESRLSGEAESISFPTSEQQIREIVKLLADRQAPLTVQSGKTGTQGRTYPQPQPNEQVHGLEP